MAIFNSYVKLPEGTNLIRVPAGHQTQHLPEYSGEYASCTLMSPPVIQDKKNISEEFQAHEQCHLQSESKRVTMA